MCLKQFFDYNYNFDVSIIRPPPNKCGIDSETCISRSYYNELREVIRDSKLVYFQKGLPFSLPFIAYNCFNTMLYKYSKNVNFNPIYRASLLEQFDAIEWEATIYNLQLICSSVRNKPVFKPSDNITDRNKNVYAFLATLSGAKEYNDLIILHQIFSITRIVADSINEDEKNAERYLKLLKPFQHIMLYIFDKHLKNGLLRKSKAYLTTL